MTDQKNPERKPDTDQDPDRSPARRKDHARDDKDEKGGRKVPGADEVEGAGAEEDKYD